MAKKTNSKEEEVLVDVTASLSKAERFFEENGKNLTIVAVAIFAIVGAYLGYIKFYQEPREEEAQKAIYHAQGYFESDSLEQAINGDGMNPGFLDIAADYSGTKIGNSANYYAGISYLRLGEFENAIRLLDEFNTDDPILKVTSLGSIGDAFLELDQPEEAYDYYQKAVKASNNAFVVPFYLLKAGMLAEKLGKGEEALGYYQRIKEDFPDSRQASNIERYIARAKAQL